MKDYMHCQQVYHWAGPELRVCCTYDTVWVGNCVFRKAAWICEPAMEFQGATPISCLVCCDISRSGQCTAHALQLWASARCSFHVSLSRCICASSLKPADHEDLDEGCACFGWVPVVRDSGSPILKGRTT